MINEKGHYEALRRRDQSIFQGRAGSVAGVVEQLYWVSQDPLRGHVDWKMVGSGLVRVGKGW